jgi:hypothetical protein
MAAAITSHGDGKQAQRVAPRRAPRPHGAPAPPSTERHATACQPAAIRHPLPQRPASIPTSSPTRSDWGTRQNPPAPRFRRPENPPGAACDSYPPMGVGGHSYRWHIYAYWPLIFQPTSARPLNLKSRIAWTVLDGGRRLCERSVTVGVFVCARAMVRGAVDGRRRDSAYPRSPSFSTWKDPFRP